MSFLEICFLDPLFIFEQENELVTPHVKEKISERYTSCLKLDGRTFLKVANNNLDLREEFTLTCWLKLDTHKTHTILDRYDRESMKGILVQVVPVRNGIGVLTLFVNEKRLRGKHPIRMNENSQLSFFGVSFKSRAKDGVRFYAEGLLEDSHSCFEPVGNTEHALSTMVGRQRENEENHLVGTIDNLSLWSRALSDVEVSSIMFSVLGGKEPGLELFYDFDDKTDFFADATMKRHDGVVKGTREIVYCKDKTFKISPCKKNKIQRIQP